MGGDNRSIVTGPRAAQVSQSDPGGKSRIKFPGPGIHFTIWTQVVELIFLCSGHNNQGLLVLVRYSTGRDDDH